MRLSVKSLFAATVLGLSGLAAPAGAQDARLVSYEELLNRVARLEEEMAEVPPAPVAAPMGAPAAEERTDDGGFYFMYESVIVTPFFSQNTSSVIVGPAPLASVRQFDWDLEYSPRFEIGSVDGCTGTGWRARYWHFDHSTNDRVATNANTAAFISPDALAAQLVGPIFALNGGIATTNHSLRMSVLDLEFLKRELSEEGGFTASVGVRYARMDQWMRGTIITPGNVVLAKNSLHHDFEGIGPTIFGEYLKRFDCSYWGMFVNARGSLLYGNSNYRYDIRFPAPALPLQANVSNINDQDLLAVAEMQIGLDYRRPTSSCHECFLRIAVEAQYWHNAGSASGDLNALGSGSAQDADLGFLGFTVATGLDW